MEKMLKKLIAVMLVITLAGANLSILGMYGITYALSNEELVDQETTTEESKNVEFNAYFEGGGHSKTENIDSKTAKLFVNVKVKEVGYLKNGVISLENTNFKIGDISDDNVQSFDKENNQIYLEQLDNDSDVTIEIPIFALESEKVSLDYFSKETKAKFTGTYIDGNGKEKTVSNEIVNKLSWNGTVEGSLYSSLTKIIPYSTGEKAGVMVQVKIESGVNNSVLPIKKTVLDVIVPEINEIKPTDVNVIALNTKATNGKIDGTNFTTDNYAYDVETGKVTITVQNSSNEIVWLKNVKDEYLVTFIFDGKDIYEHVKENGATIDVTTNALLELYNNVETYENVATSIAHVSDKPITGTFESIGTIADFNIEAIETQISKGQVYSNYNKESVKKETTYFTRYISTINSVELTDTITFTQSIDKFLTEEDKEGLTTVSGKNYTYNKIVKINEKIFNKILGKEGTINLYDVSDDEETTPIGIINKDTQLVDGYYTIDISSKNNNQIKIVSSKPITEGQLVIDIEKAIKTEIDYGKTQFKDFSKIEMNLEGKASVSTVNAMAQILLKETTSVAKIEISKTDLTTVVKNKNVEIRATLDTSSLFNALYTNPTLKIKLPSYISKVDLKQTDIIMANGLEIKGKPSVTYENDGPEIYVELEGTQKEYTVDAEYKGTIVVLNTDLTTEMLTPTSAFEVTMEFTNASDTSTNSKGTAKTKIAFIAPVGVVTANGIDDMMSISDEVVTGNILAHSESKVSTVYGKVVNNYINAINNIVILGRFPVENNKKIDTTESLGSTFSTTLKTNIAVKGIEEGKYTVYYSENVDETVQFTDSVVGWSTEATSNAKSYMIVTNDYEMPAGGTIEFSYDVEIPEQLKYNDSVYQMYKVYYDNISPIGTMSETKTSTRVGLTTGQGVELEATLKSTVDTVREGQIVKMKVDVKNTGSMVAENVKVSIPLPKKATFMEYITGNTFKEEKETTKEIEIGTIEVGKTKQVSYYIKFDDEMKEYVEPENPNAVTPEELDIILNGDKFPKEIVNVVTITADKLSKGIKSNECIINVEDGQISLNMVSDIMESVTLKKGEVLTYLINITNISGKGDLNNTVVTIPLVDGTKYKSAVIKEDAIDENEVTEGISYNEETNTVQVNIGTLEYTKLIVLEVEVEEFDGSVNIMAKAKAEGTEENYSNITEYMSEIIELEVSELTSTPKYVKEGEEITYSLTITNKGDSTIYKLSILDILPKELTFVKATYTYAKKEQTVTTSKNNTVEITFVQLEEGESITIKVIAKTRLLDDENELEVQNQMVVNVGNSEQITTNTVKNVIEYNEELRQEAGLLEPIDPSNPSDPSNPTVPTEKKYKITGTAWLDSDRNGKREESEEILPDITVMLVNNLIETEINTKNQMITTTDNQGKYEFDNLSEGQYMVIFLYNSSKYSLTTYQRKDVDESVNSDVINIKITLDGKRIVAGTTDAIEITDSNIRDIDIGMYVSEKFDLKIDKFISKITLTTPTIGTKVYTEGNSKLEKVEVLEKNLGKSNIVIEYKIVVTNQGAVPGYAKKIVDYLPEGVGFNTELNRDWYLSDNGNVYNASLANEIINPGESKQITLVVTKKITEKSLGTLNNNVEIYESYNEQGLKDIDSTEGNKVQDEDDISNANIILSIATGKILMYTTIILGVMAILAFGIYEIKRRVLNKEN